MVVRLPLIERLVGALDVAEVMGYLACADMAGPLALADRVLAMLHRLANPRRCASGRPVALPRSPVWSARHTPVPGNCAM